MSESLEAQLRSLNFNEELKSTFDKIIESCPKFRILLVGRSGVGKSALINAVFGSGVVDEEHGLQAGVVKDINREFVLPNNDRLVLHDSQGFSHGDGQNFETVLKFIKDRSKRPELEDRLHIIWLCIEIPVYGGSLFEIAEEKILNSMDLETPIIVVFTKFDKPVLKIKRKLPKTEDQNTIARSKARETFCTDYAAALSTLSKSIPRVEVSVKSGFKDTLDLLVDLTEKEVKGVISFIWASSQCPNVDLKIEASIQIGYDLLLGVPTTLTVNLFKKKMTSLQEDLLEDDSSNLPKITLGGTAAVAGIISGVIPPAAPFAVPIAAGIIFAAWVYKVYLTTPQVLRGLMGYIVDLTIVMQSLFWLTRARAEAVSKGGAMVATVPLTKRLVELAFTAYATDEHSKTIHEDLRPFVKPTFALKPDIVLDHIVELIKSHRFQPSQSFAAKAEAGRETGEEDVNWETGVRA
ncbi:G domain-containing protein [Mycena venus]|uniref:G domain-containing protein n=1 Tax=Mycena venus TaxID=2733690 RepID=A0A8H7CEB5_9AGAR|nr:G domain-containing protein [Mycena venus]